MSEAERLDKRDPGNPAKDLAKQGDNRPAGVQRQNDPHIPRDTNEGIPDRQQPGTLVFAPMNGGENQPLPRLLTAHSEPRGPSPPLGAHRQKRVDAGVPRAIAASAMPSRRSAASAEAVGAQ